MAASTPVPMICMRPVTTRMDMMIIAMPIAATVTATTWMVRRRLAALRER